MVGADIELVGELVGRRGLLRSRLSVDTLRAASPSDRVGPPRLVRACSKGGYEEPGSKGHHCRSMARCGAMLVRRCGRCNSQNVGGVDDEIDLNEGVVILKGSVRTTAAEGLREAVFGGLGLCVASEWMFQPDLDNRRVKQILPAWALPPIDLWAAFPTGRRASAKARVFAAFIENQLRQTNFAM